MKKKILIQTAALAAVLSAETAPVDLETISVADTVSQKEKTEYTQSDFNSVTRSRTLDGFLQDLEGVDVVRQSGAIRSKGVYLRGFDETRCAVVLNGRLLNGSGSFGGDFVDWNSIPLEQIESVEVIRGAKTAEYGSSIGGVIKITTAKPAPKQENHMRFSYGAAPNWDHRKILDQSRDASISHKNSIGKRLDYTINLGTWQNDGLLRNNFMKRNSIGASAAVHLPAGVELNGSFVRTETDNGYIIQNKPGTRWFNPSYPAAEEGTSIGSSLVWKGGDKYFGDRSYWENQRSQYDLSLNKKFKNLTLAASGYLNDQNRTEYFYDIADSSKLILERKSKPEDFTGGWKASAEQVLKTHKLLLGTEGQRLNSETYNVLQVDTSFFRTKPEDIPHDTKLARTLGIFAEDNFSLLDTVLDLHAGVRFDHFKGLPSDTTISEKKSEEMLHSGFSPSGGIEAHLWKGGSVGADGALVTRMPNSSEFFWYFNGFVPAGRTELVPEKAYQVEGSLEQSFLKGNITATVRGYWYSVSDYIRSIMGARPSHAVYNIEKAEFKGIELKADCRLPKYLSFSGSYSYQKTSKEGDILDAVLIQPKYLSELPKHRGNASVSFESKRGTSARIKVHAVSSKQTVSGSQVLSPVKGAVPAKLQSVDSYAVTDIGGSVPLIKKSDLTLKLNGSVDNIFDVRYEEKAGYPMAGTTLQIGIDAAF